VTVVPGQGKCGSGYNGSSGTTWSHPIPGIIAVFLSGNSQLEKILQHALKNQVFVQDVHGFLKKYWMGRINDST